MDIANKLKNKRKEHNLTQEQISQKLHVSRQTISNWETGKSVPDIYNLVELSNLYDISLDELIKEDIVMMKELKKENKVKKMINKLIMISGVGVLILAISFILPNPHVQDFARGMGIGLLSVSALASFLIKVLNQLYK
ncbi:helix-turn-helix domain-containing protein [Vagococcus fluvialis]|uniref:helix-turn-helix domain-containing protein n=1 Tax=Vagococcus fluvialis TaxID=2738 RepID=UPI003B21431A